MEREVGMEMEVEEDGEEKGDEADEAPAKSAGAVDMTGMPSSSREGSGAKWDKQKRLWRVRVCLAGGGSQHVDLDEAQGVAAHSQAGGGRCGQEQEEGDAGSRGGIRQGQ
ncbi:hypothetical protein T484DRAFT_1904960, partial [Baffinella frigidus]